MLFPKGKLWKASYGPRQARSPISDWIYCTKNLSRPPKKKHMLSISLKDLLSCVMFVVIPPQLKRYSSMVDILCNFSDAFKSSPSLLVGYVLCISLPLPTTSYNICYSKCEDGNVVVFVSDC